MHADQWTSARNWQSMHPVWTVIVIGLLVLADMSPWTTRAIAQTNRTAPTGDSSQLQPKMPRSFLASKAYQVLDQHCARCHQQGHPGFDGQTGSQEPTNTDHQLFNILDLSKISSDSTLVRRGLPDASDLYNVMVTRAMPPQSARTTRKRSKNHVPLPSAKDLKRVRDWIESLEPAAKPPDKVTSTASSKPAHSSKTSQPSDNEWRISLSLDKPRYNIGDVATIYARTSHDCRLTIIAIDRTGIATVLFPNGFARDNLIRVGQVIALPASGAGYRLKFDHAGRETIVGLCAHPDIVSLPEIDNQFDAQQFTVLGDWRDHITKTYELEAHAFKRGKVPNGRRRIRRRNGHRRKTPRRPNWLTHHEQPYLRARTAITVSIEP